MQRAREVDEGCTAKILTSTHTFTRFCKSLVRISCTREREMALIKKRLVECMNLATKGSQGNDVGIKNR